MLRRYGLRQTKQRRALIGALRHSQGHNTAQALLSNVRREQPGVDASTVYRSLTQLRNLGLVAQTDLGTGERTYSWRGDEPHHHLVCQSCGAITELPHDYLHPLEARLSDEFGFRAEMDHWAVHGVCSRCRERGTTPS